MDKTTELIKIQQRPLEWITQVVTQWGLAPRRSRSGNAIQAVAAVIGALLLSSGCVKSGSTELSSVRQELYKLRHAHEMAQKRIARLEAQLEASKDKASSPSGVSLRSPTAAVMSPSDTVGSTRRPASSAGMETGSIERRVKALPVVRVGDNTVVMSKPKTAGVGAQDQGQPPVMIRMRGEQTPVERLTVDHKVLRQPDPILGKRAKDAQRSYQRALKTLRELRDPDSALQMFAGFLSKHARHHLADNAVYWSGEAHQMLVQHEQAIGLFSQLIDRYPNSNKVPWAKLRMAQSQLALGQTDAGRALLESVQSEYPKSEPARLASLELAR